MIMNEMIKSAKDLIATRIAEIFNLIFDSNLYQAQWSENILTPLFKGAELNDPGNYRGISVSSCFAKLYSAVLNERLINAIDKFNLISREQTGFLKGVRTTDHSLCMNFLVNKLFKEGNKTTYVALVDLRKAYDRIDRNFLIYKMQRKVSGHSSCNASKY